MENFLTNFIILILQIVIFTNVCLLSMSLGYRLTQWSLPVKGFFFLKNFKRGGTTIYPFIFVHKKSYLTRTEEQRETLIQHEMIHLVQQYEGFVVGIYMWYILEYLVRLLVFRSHLKAYLTNSMEVEAYVNEDNPVYLISRKKFNWFQYAFTSNKNYTHVVQRIITP
jgi:hypothetical protein